MSRDRRRGFDDLRYKLGGGLCDFMKRRGVLSCFCRGVGWYIGELCYGSGFILFKDFRGEGVYM